MLFQCLSLFRSTLSDKAALFLIVLHFDSSFALSEGFEFRLIWSILRVSNYTQRVLNVWTLIRFSTD